MKGFLSNAAKMAARFLSGKKNVATTSECSPDPVEREPFVKREAPEQPRKALSKKEFERRKKKLKQQSKSRKINRQ